MQSKTTVIHLCLVTVVALFALGCGGKKDKSGDDKKSGAAASKAKKKAQPWVVKKLPKMKLSVQVPANAKVEETKQDAWNASINTPDYDFQIRVVTVTGAYSGFAGEVKDEEKHHSLKFVKWIKKEKTKGGFHLQCEQKTSEGKPHYSVKIRTTIGGKKFQCWQTTEDAKKLPAILKACQSIQGL